MPLVRSDQHVDDLAQCAVGCQTAVFKQMVEAAEIITFACDRLSLLISPKATMCCSDVLTEALLRRGLLELGINVGVARRTRDLGVDTGGGRAVEVMRKRLRKAAKRSRRLAVFRRHTKKSDIWPCTSFGAAGMGIAPSTMQGIRSRAADAVCPKSGCVTSSIAIGLPYNADSAALGRDRVRQAVAWCSGTTLMNLSARACAELGG